MNLSRISCDAIAMFDAEEKEKWIEAMYARVHMDRDWLRGTLRRMGPPPKFSQGWTPDNPTFGYCAVVTFALAWMLRAVGEKCRTMKIEGNHTLHGHNRNVHHYFLTLEDGTIIDLTAEQVDYYFPYSHGKLARGVLRKRGAVRHYAEELRSAMQNRLLGCNHI